FRSSRCIASVFILQNQNHASLAGFLGGVVQFFIDRRTVPGLIVKSPEIEATYTIGSKGFCQLDTAIEHFALLKKRKIGIELIAFRAELRLWSTRPIHFK